jgi:hypothetical protein
MKREDAESVSIFYVEAGDEKQAILDALSTQPERKDGIVIVLPRHLTRAFQSPKDFHDLKLLKRQENLPIVFVIPEGNAARGARSNGFPVYASLEALLKPAKRRSAPLPPPRLVSDQLPLDDPFASFSSAAPRGQFDYAPFSASLSAAQDELAYPSFSLPVTPLPPVAEASQSDAFFVLPEDADAFSMLRENSGMLPTPREQPVPEERRGRSMPLPTISPPAPAPAIERPRSKRLWLMLVLAVVVICASLSAGLVFAGAPLHILPGAPPAATVGHVFFLSSGQLGQMGTEGINDTLEISLSHLSPPAQGKSYYAWLESDLSRSDGPVMLLGKLNVSPSGTVRLTYVDPQHTDLLASMSRFLITEESASVTPTVPSPDLSTWRYQGIIPQTPNPHDQNHYSLLDHLRHLLASDPTLEKLGLHGGLVLWLYRNSGKLLEWTRNAQDDWSNPAETGVVRRQVIRTLEYIDGLKAVSRDVPAGTPVLVDPVQGSVGLLQIYADETPPGYTQHIGLHLAGLLTSPGATSAQRQLASQLQAALDNVQNWLEQARSDARQLVVLSDTQLQNRAALALLNDLVVQVMNAYVGTTDPATGNQQQGVVWLYSAMHNLAIIDVQTVTQQ